MKDFEYCINIVLKFEGGFVDNPQDPGGATKYGISQRAYPSLDIKNLTIEQAKIIYKMDYWNKAGCENMAWPMNLLILDTSVNLGVSKAIDLIYDAPDWRDYLLRRINKYMDIVNRDNTKKLFLRGWLNRVMGLYEIIKRIS